jgi:hypothetical protein
MFLILSILKKGSTFKFKTLFFVQAKKQLWPAFPTLCRDVTLLPNLVSFSPLRGG